MTFDITHGTTTYSVRARSWYEARLYAQAQHGESLRTVVFANRRDDESSIEIPALKTVTELAYEHGESLREAGRREGRREAFLEAIELLRKECGDGGIFAEIKLVLTREASR